MVDVLAETGKLAETVELAIGGKLYAGWTGVSVSSSLDTVTGTFALSLAPRDVTAGAEVEIAEGDRCELRVAGEPVINGWVDTVGLDGDADGRSIRVTGRDRTGDLADCSAIHKPGSWRNATIETIAAELAKPFGISVTAKASTGKAIPKFALQPGETVQAAIERLLRFRGLLMVPNAKGDLEIMTPEDGAPILTLEYGVNILRFSATHDGSQRFSQYLVKGQAAGNDEKHGKTVSQIKGDASDAGVKRHRPLLIVAEEQGDGASLAERAKWEAVVRAGRARSCAVTVIGWRVAAGGKLWARGMRVRLKCPPARFADEQMLVSAVDFAKGEGGTTTTLTLMPPGAWKQLPGGGA